MSRAKKAPVLTPAVDPAATAAVADKTPTKAATVLTLLNRGQGATLNELVEATAWQPHTTRAMLTGLRKKGHAIERRKRGEVSCYHLAVVAVA